MDAKTQLKELQQQLALVQQAMGRQHKSAIIVLEGPDAAGKGGIVRRLGWCLDPRWLHVHPIGAPSESEKNEHWLQRFWRLVPAQGELAVFDRSWYGRVLVERVEQFCEPAAWQRAYPQINDFERILTEENIRLIKIFLDISEQTQYERLAERFVDPSKNWKLTLEDLRNRARWQDYQRATQEMIEQTSTNIAPWHLIDANDKHLARLSVFNLLLNELSRDLDLSLPAPDPSIIAYFQSTPHGQ